MQNIVLYLGDKSMGRWLGLFVVFVMSFLYCFASSNSMFWGLSRWGDCIEILSDLDNLNEIIKMFVQLLDK